MPAIAEWVPVWKLREMIGAEAADKLLKARGGAKVHVPARVTERSIIAEIIGVELAQRLGDHFATGVGMEAIGVTLELPRGNHGRLSIEQRRLQDMIGAEATDREIIAELDINARTIRRWRKQLGKAKPGKPGPKDPRLAAMVLDPALSNAQICEALKVSNSTVNKWRSRLTGIKRRRGRAAQVRVAGRARNRPGSALLPQ